jgi:hypothetical protein
MQAQASRRLARYAAGRREAQPDAAAQGRGPGATGSTRSEDRPDSSGGRGVSHPPPPSTLHPFTQDYDRIPTAGCLCFHASLIIWDTRLPHSAASNIGDAPRVAQYITMNPAGPLTEEVPPPAAACVGVPTMAVKGGCAGDVGEPPLVVRAPRRLRRAGRPSFCCWTRARVWSERHAWELTARSTASTTRCPNPPPSRSWGAGLPGSNRGRRTLRLGRPPSFEHR